MEQTNQMEQTTQTNQMEQMEQTKNNMSIQNKSNNILNNIKKIFGIASTTIIWEHVAKCYEITTRPSLILMFTETQLKYLFKIFGSYCAQISSFLWHLNWNSLYLTIKDVISPIIGSCISPFYTFVGYYNTVRQKYNGQLSIILFGSLLLVSLFSFGVYKYKKRISHKGNHE